MGDPIIIIMIIKKRVLTTEGREARTK